MAQASEPVIHRSCFVGVNIQRACQESGPHRIPQALFCFLFSERRTGSSSAGLVGRGYPCPVFMDERIHRFLIPILVALCIVSVSLTLSAPVFAADPWSPDVEFGTNVSDSSMREYRDRISATYKFILSMAAPFALVTITVGGLIAFLGSEKDAERGFSMIKMSLIALMALYLLPLVISAAYNSLNGVKWDPAHPDFTW